jgi:hypothetical protein
MAPYFKATIIISVLLAALAMNGCGSCGFDCSSDDEITGPAVLDLGFSDALPEDLKTVVLEVDSIVFQRSSDPDIIIDTFSVGDVDPNQPEESFQINLLAYRGAAQELVIQNLEMEPDTYSGIVINLTDEDINNSHVQESDDSVHTLVTSSGGLELSGIRLSSGSSTHTIEFDLPRSLRYDEDNDRYRLTSDGVRVVDNAKSGLLAGVVDEQLFDAVTPCDEKADPLKGNRVYLYEGIGLDTESLGDVFTDDGGSNVIAPYSVSTILQSSTTGAWEYVFGYLPTGDYTIAFSCDAEEDDPDAYDELPIPFPEDQIYEVSLSTSGNRNCNFDPDSTDAC